jgi:twitching motility two-component system response regulator PilG
MPSTDRAEARACFKEAAAINPNDSRVWQALAKLAETPAEAVDALRELIRVAPEQPHGQFALRNALAADARALAEAGRADDARARWQEILATSNSDIEAWLGVAATASNEDEAVSAIETAHRLNPAHEGVIEAKARLERSKIDPATVAPPVDAFARFDGPADGLAFGSGDEADLDSSLDAFAQFAEAAAAPAPAAAAPAAAPPAPAPVAEAQSAPDPVVDLESALEQATAVETVSIETMSIGSGDSAVSLDFDAVLNSLELSSAVKPEPPVAPAVAQAPTPPPTPAPAPMPVPTPAPIATAEVAPATPAATVSAPASSGSSGSTRKTVMIVDDSPTIRKILGLTLERAGYKVVAEPDGESAIERLIQVVPDLILLDIAMPKIDGYEVCKRIKQDPRTKHVPVVMLSGKGALFDKVKGHMAGASEYLTKPFETPAVLAVVANYCEKTAEVVNG